MGLGFGCACWWITARSKCSPKTDKSLSPTSYSLREESRACDSTRTAAPPVLLVRSVGPSLQSGDHFMNINAYLLRSTAVAALGGLLFGFDTAVIAGATHQLTEAYQLSPGALGLTVASALWGTILGALFAGIPGDRFGRRDSLRAMAVLYLVSALGCALAWDWYSLVFFRFIGGLGIGGSSVLGPMYIAEIAPARWRGRL